MFGDHREGILKTAKALVEDTKTLVAGAASSQEQLAAAAQASVRTMTKVHVHPSPVLQWHGTPCAILACRRGEIWCRILGRSRWRNSSDANQQCERRCLGVESSHQRD